MVEISSYFINKKQICKCDNKGYPVFPCKFARRKLEINEDESERLYVEAMKRCRFNAEKSLANAWLCANFKIKKSQYPLIVSVSKFFSVILRINLPREVYRRRTCCLFWMENYGNFIFDACNRYEIVVVNSAGKKIKLRAPNVASPQSSPVVPEILQQHVDVPKATEDIFKIFEAGELDIDIDSFFAELNREG